MWDLLASAQHTARENEPNWFEQSSVKRHGALESGGDHIVNLHAVRRRMWNPGISPDFRVNYMIIGVQKAGTTALARLLSRHPDLYLPRRKELHFFDDRRLMESRDYRLYHSFFFNYRGQRMVGEATPSYIYAPYTAAALNEYNSRLKLILVLRNPVDRAFSQYNMNVHLGNEMLPFDEALMAEEQRLEAHRKDYGRGTVANRFSYKERGRYAAQIQNLLAYFPPDQLCVLKYEELVADYLATLKQIYRFLNVGDFVLENVRMNSNTRTGSMTTDVREHLTEFFAPEFEALEKLLGWDLANWRL